MSGHLKDAVFWGFDNEKIMETTGTLRYTPPRYKFLSRKIRSKLNKVKAIFLF